MALSRIREFFLQERAQRLARLGRSGSDAEVRRLLLLARQRLTAGHSLWDVGFRADGMRLTVEALDAALEATGRMSPAPPPAGSEAAPAESDAAPVESDARPAESDAPPAESEAPPVESAAPPVESDAVPAESDGAGARDRALDRLEIDRRLRGRITEAIKETSVPELDEEVRPEHEARYERAARAARQLLSALQPLLLTPARVKLKRVARFATVGALFVIALLLGYRWAFPPPRIVVTASEDRAGEKPATNAFDNNPQTEWQMLDRHRGYLEFDLEPPRRIAAVKLLNGYNPPFNDRATRRYRIEVTGEADQPTIFRGEFPELDTSPEWQRVDLGVQGGMPGVSLVRVHIDSSHGMGAALAEVAFEEIAAAE